MMKINNIWLDLEKDSENHTGLLYKRYASEVLPDVFVALKSPEHLRCLAIEVSSAFLFSEHQWNNLKDIKIEIFQNDRDKSKNFLLIILLNMQHRDIFSTLCEDLIFSVFDVNLENILIERLIERLSKWQSLFERAESQGLSAESQRGLYGELYFLRLFLNNSGDKNFCINSWTGPERTAQDFQYSNWAVEIKTSQGNNHQKIHISNERQLDDSLVEKIFLYHLSLEVRNSAGETLNFLIDEIFDLLFDNIVASNLFRFRLLESGYYHVHREIYQDKGYAIRQENIYKVSGNFPRIIESQVPAGVGDVKYSIVLSDSEQWQINQELLFTEIR